jgi:hypothetical protein
VVSKKTTGTPAFRRLMDMCSTSSVVPLVLDC